jgi:hypothetical protein
MDECLLLGHYTKIKIESTLNSTGSLNDHFFEFKDLNFSKNDNNQFLVKEIEKSIRRLFNILYIYRNDSFLTSNGPIF